VRDDAHRVQQFAAEKLQPYDAPIGIVRQVLLKQEQIVGQPQRRIAGEERFDLLQ